MEEGDLVYIPQAVPLYNLESPRVDVTQKPILGIFIKKHDEKLSSIFAKGETMWVSTRHIYPMEEAHAR